VPDVQVELLLFGMTPLLFFLNDENPICLSQKKKEKEKKA